MGKTTGPRPSITVETRHEGLADIAALPQSPPGRKPAGDAAPDAAMDPAGHHTLLRAGGALTAYTGIAEASPGFGTFDDGGDSD